MTLADVKCAQDGRQFSLFQLLGAVGVLIVIVFETMMSELVYGMALGGLTCLILYTVHVLIHRDARRTQRERVYYVIMLIATVVAWLAVKGIAREAAQSRAVQQSTVRLRQAIETLAQDDDRFAAIKVSAFPRKGFIVIKGTVPSGVEAIALRNIVSRIKPMPRVDWQVVVNVPVHNQRTSRASDAGVDIHD